MYKETNDTMDYIVPVVDQGLMIWVSKSTDLEQQILSNELND
jgi:hypothetical protein